MREKIAMTMAFVAMLGAVAAFRTALTEQETSRLERTLDQGQILELAARQGYLEKTAINARMDDLYNQRHDLGLYLAKKANEIRSQDPTRAARLDLKAQEEFTAARVYIPVRDYLSVDMGKLKLEDSVEKLATADLTNYGFDVLWPDKPDNEGKYPSIWGGLKKKIEKYDQRVIRLASATVMFVFSLAAFTFAQLSIPMSKREKWLEIAGYALAASALVFALVVEPASWKDFALATAAFFLLGRIGQKLSRRVKVLEHEEPEEEPCHPGEVEPLLFAGARMHGSGKKDSFTRTIVFFIAVTAVLSALSGFWYSRAATAANKAAAEAMEHQVELFKGSSRPATSIYYVLGSMGTAQEYRSRYQSARQRYALAPDGLPAGAVGEPYEEMNQIASMEEAQDPKNQIANWLGGDFGPYEDMRYPEKFVMQGLRQDAEEEFGLWDAKNELSLAWRRIANTELATITLFAIALYLFGQSLGMGRTRAAFILVFLSSSLVILGAARALIVRLEPLPGRPHTVKAECKEPDAKTGKIDPAVDAAKHYAEGRRKFGMANENEATREAVKDFRCAVDARPSFALANFELARAIWNANTPQHGEGWTSLTAKDSIPDVVEYQDKALKALDQEGLGRPLTMLGNHGFDNVMMAFRQKDTKYLKHGVQASRAALAKDDKAQWTRFNLGMGLFASGAKDEALMQYNIGLKESVPSPLASASITDLNLMLRYCDQVNPKSYCAQLGADVDRLKSRFVLSAWPPTDAKGVPRLGRSLSVSDVELAASPAGLGWHARIQNYDGKHDSLTVVWYAKEEAWDVWRVLPGISGSKDPESMTEESDGKRFQLDSILDGTNAHRCLQQGTYRGEIYLNGRMLPGHDISLTTVPFEAAGFRDLNMAMCHPKDWVRWTPKDNSNPGLIRGYVDNHNKRGAFVFTYYYPKVGTDIATRDKFLRRSANFLLAKNLLEESQMSQDQAACTAYPEERNVTRVRYARNGVTLMARSWTEKNGLVHVGIVFRNGLYSNPAREAAAHMEDCGTLVSFTTVW